MPKRPMSICKRTGCNALLSTPGYCPKHAIDHDSNKRDRFERIDNKKTPEEKKFYSGSAWTKASKMHRSKEPLCRRCKAEGKIRIGELTHHNPELSVLIESGLNPYNDDYLETLCIPHHQQELSRKNNHEQK